MTENLPGSRSPLRRALRVSVFAGLYVLLANARSAQVNPLIPGAVMAVFMIVPVAAGILEGPRAGLLVGILGPLATAAVYWLRGAGEPAMAAAANPALVQLVSAFPFALMGLLAGWLERYLPPPLPASALLAGHVLNHLTLIALGLMPASAIRSLSFCCGVAWEAFILIALVTAAVGIYRLGFERQPD